MNVNQLKQQLDEKGIVILENQLPVDVLTKMQQTFERQLAHPQFNTWQGYQQNEKWRLLIEDLLTLSPAFLYPVLNDELMSIFRDYIGDGFQMTEARGWETIKTNRNFHGYHNDGWYDVDRCAEPPPQLKLGVYLTDVESGEFCYVETSHRQKLKPDHWNMKQVEEMGLPVNHVKGKAGTMFIFDTSGIHRQNSPVLDPRRAILYNFHDPAAPIQESDIEYDRYAPLLLNAAFLKDLTKEQERILGFGDQRYFNEGSVPQQRYPLLHKMTSTALATRLFTQDCQQFMRRVWAKLT